MNFLVTIVFSIYSIIACVFGFAWSAPYDPADTPESELPSYVVVGDMRVQLLSESLVRIEKEGPKGFENRSSFTVQKRSWDKIDYTQKTENGYVVIETAKYIVYVPESAESCEGCYIVAKDGEELWRFDSDTDSNVYLPSPSDELDSWYFTDTPRVIPSEDGYDISILWYYNNGWDSSNDSQDVFVFLPDGDYETFTKDFTDLTGESEMLTLNLLGYWDSRYYEYTAESAMQQIEDYTDRGYPLDVLVIDTDWRNATSGAGYAINRKNFPNMKRFLEDVHEKNVSVVFNDHPEPAVLTDNLLDKTEVISRNYNLKNILNKGLDYWWYDRNWWTSLKLIDEDLSIYTTGMYAYYWITKDFYEDKAARGKYPVRPLIMANIDGINNGDQAYASELAAHRYSLQWTGDIGTAANSLSAEIFNTVYGSNIMGIPYISSDLGGHTSEVTDDMYVRWIQYGALSPIMRVHCTKPYSRMPWLYGDTAEDVTHTYVDMRYRLLPGFYSLAHENYETGLPLTRRLDVNYPQYKESSANDQYLLGDDILVAPIYESYPETDKYTFTSDGKEGLKAEYYANSNFEGTPEITRYESKIYYDWQLGSPKGLSVSDYFTVRWSGQLTVGEEDIFFSAYSDDGIRIIIDGKTVVDGWNTYNQHFRTEFLKAGSTHDITIEYCDGNEYAHVYITAHCNGDAQRSVFIPDGMWMDIWTGETYVGPKTIQVSHSLETSPVFVRKGSVITLADNMLNTSEKDWSHLTLDVYPSVDFDGETVLYEDDTKTTAYKDGHYRTTDITLTGDKTQVLTINQAEGSFDGERAFTKRNYTVRVHGRDDWGKLLTVTVNGKKVAFTTIAKDENAEPLAITGGARDNTVYEITFEADVYEKTVITLEFEYASKDGRNDSYDNSETEIALSVKELDKNSADFTISEDAEDWILYGLNWDYETVSKSESDESLNAMTCRGDVAIFDDNYKITWTDGDIKTEGSTTCGIVGYHEMTTTLKNDGKSQYKLYLGGHKSVGTLTVRDSSGNVETVSFGDMDGNYYREITIDADGNSDLQVTYSLSCGINITAAACVKY